MSRARRSCSGSVIPIPGYDQGVAVFRDLAAKPATAHFIATKLARHFIADDPPPRAVERIANAFLSSDGHLPTVYRALIESPEAWDATARQNTRRRTTTSFRRSAAYSCRLKRAARRSRRSK